MPLKSVISTLRGVRPDDSCQTRISGHKGDNGVFDRREVQLTSKKLLSEALALPLVTSVDVFFVFLVLGASSESFATKPPSDS